jgi:hypothetical protein
VGGKSSWWVGLTTLPATSTDWRLVLNEARHWNTCVRLRIWSPKACWIIVRVSVALFPRLAQNVMHTRWSFLLSIMKIATGQVHYSQINSVKTANVHPATCSFVHWLIRHGITTIFLCFALPQMLYRWRHQSGMFWIPPRVLKPRSLNLLENS